MNPLTSSLGILKKRRKGHYVFIFAVLLLLFIQSFFAGQTLYKTDKAKAESLIDQIKNIQKIKFLQNILKEGHFALTAMFIFANNFLIDVFSLYSGIFLIFPIIIPLSNILLLGFLLGIESMMPPSLTFLRIILLILVAGLEVLAMILVTYEGLRIGISWINPKTIGKKKRKDALKQTFFEGSKILFLIAIILIIAAIIETIGIAYLENIF